VTNLAATFLLSAEARSIIATFLAGLEASFAMSISTLSYRLSSRVARRLDDWMHHRCQECGPIVRHLTLQYPINCCNVGALVHEIFSLVLILSHAFFYHVVLFTCFLFQSLISPGQPCNSLISVVRVLFDQLAVLNMSQDDVKYH
jgi:hypothetical protein